MPVLDDALKLKRHHLITQCALQRLQVAVLVSQLEKPLSLANTAFDAMLIAKKHPWLLFFTVLIFKRLHQKNTKHALIVRCIKTLVKVKLFASWVLRVKALIHK